MHKLIGRSLLLLLALAHAAAAELVSGAAADRVLGQDSFTADFVNPAGTAQGLNGATGIAVDPGSGKLFVSDLNNNRVLRFGNAAALANDAAAEAVIGQADFSSVASDTSQTRLNRPYGVHVDSVGRLWVADYDNNRVMMWENASTIGNGAPANKVFGQLNFTDFTPSVSSSRMDGPVDVFVDGSDRLWVAEYHSNRVLRFDDISNKLNGASADGVLGQPGFGSNAASTSRSRMDDPAGVVGDASGRIWVTDSGNNRVLRFDAAATLPDGPNASQVLGQTDFVTGIPGLSSVKMHEPYGLALAPDGSLWVPDYLNNRVLKFAAAATLSDGAAATVVLGQPDFTTGSAATSASKMAGPIAVDFDLAGNLWSAEVLNSRALRFSLTSGPSPTASDVTPPTLRFKGKVPKMSGKSRVRIRGTAIDDSGAVRVEIWVNRRAVKNVMTVSKWSVRAKLKKGKNQIRVTSTDSSGNASRLKKVIRRKLP